MVLGVNYGDVQYTCGCGQLRRGVYSRVTYLYRRTVHSGVCSRAAFNRGNTVCVYTAISKAADLGGI